MWDDSIILRKEDFKDEVLDNSVRDLLAAINDVKIFNALTDLMLRSAYWTEANFKQEYEKWEKSNGSYQLLGKARQAIFDTYIEQCLMEAENSFGWDKFRGALAESVVEKAFGNYCKTQARGVMGEIYKGCAVHLKGDKVKYQCGRSSKQQELCHKENQYCAWSKKDGCDGRRETVDLGVVTLVKGPVRKRLDCVETKLSPKGFCYLEGAYLALLRKELTAMGAEYEIIVASLERRSMIESRVKALMEDSANITIWGIGEIREWYFVRIGQFNGHLSGPA